MRNKSKIIIYSVLLTMLLGLVGYKKVYPVVLNYMEKKQNDDRANRAEQIYVKPEVQTPIVDVAKQTPIPATAKLKVPFTVQAPNRTWSIRGEDCEEAALLMYHYFLQGKSFPGDKIPADQAINELDAMVAWQHKNYGSEKDLSLNELGKFGTDYYGYSYRLINNLTIEDIKKEVASGNMVIVPVKTAILRTEGRGHYSAGDVYHVFPIIGYTESGVITNDNGFTQGQNWFYTWDVLMRAIDAQNLHSPARVGLIIYKK